MSRYLRIWLAQWRYSFVREMMFQGNFILWILVDLAWFGLQIAFVEVLYLQVNTIAGWTKWEMVLLLGTANLIQYTFQALLMINCMRLPELIRTGQLDYYLAQPAHPQFLVSTRFFDPGATVSGGVALFLVIFSLVQLQTIPTPAQTFAYFLLVACGVGIHYALMLGLMTPSFWLTRAQGIGVAYFNLFQIARIPREAFSGFFRAVFTFALPMLLVANVPAQVLAGLARPGDLLLLAAMTLLLLTLSHLIFRYGLSQYTSASS